MLSRTPPCYSAVFRDISIVSRMNTPVHSFADGFLSEAVREVRSEVHNRYAEHVGLTYSINRRAVALQHDLLIHVDKLEEAIGAALYARTLACTQSAVLLLEHGLPTQARTVLRSALESLFPLAAIAKDATLAPALLASHDADRRTLVDRIRRWKDPALRASIDSKVTEAELSAMSAGTGKPTNVYELAKAADMEDWYLTLYTLLSFAAHAKVSDLDRHVVLDETGEATEFQNEPDTSDQGTVWAWVGEVQLAAMRSIASLFSLDANDLESLRERLEKLVAHDAANPALQRTASGGP